MKNSSTLIFSFLMLALGIHLRGQVPDVGISPGTWEHDKHASIKNGILSFSGSHEYFTIATRKVPTDSIKRNGTIYWQAEIRLRNIVKGPKMYMRPKLKILYGKGNGKPLAKYNLPSFQLEKWTTVTLPLNTKLIGGAKMLRFELGMEKCAGTFEVRNSRLSYAKPQMSDSFPYPVPDKTGATLNIDTTVSRPFADDLLGLNSHFVWSRTNYQDECIRSILASLRVPHLRFPAGTVANFYDWHTDMPDFPETLGAGPSWIKYKKKEGWQYGFKPYAELCRELKMSSELTFNIMWGTPEDTAKRLIDRQKRLHRISWIELGNENYFPRQDYGHAKNVQSYIAYTKKVTAALKRADPQAKVAVNMEPEFEADTEYGPWGLALAKQDYYDGVVIHPYVNSNSFQQDDMAKLSLLGSYAYVKHAIEETTRHVNKPLVISEWGVLGSLDSTDNFFATMARAGAFFALVDGFENGQVAEACLHIFYNGSDQHNSALFLNDKGHDKIFKTRRGVFFEMLIKVFRNSTLLSAKAKSTELAKDTPAVQAKAVSKDGSIFIFALNRLPVSSDLRVRLDGKPFSGSHQIQTFGITEGTKSRYELNENPCRVLNGKGLVRLPRYSISIIKIEQ